ncbi:hypothetical protein [Streptomyces sp. NPDC101234]|uniref:hypothetical protein n=1 Tax=Streptomyces sp. NPDC101234 TaxID=3366138 RepID=UPI00382B4D1D
MNTTTSPPARRLTAAGALAALVLTGCGISNAATDPGGGSTSRRALSGICAASTQRNGVVHCTKLFPGTKPVRLPGDPSRTQRYGAVERGVPTFHTRGSDLPLTAAVTRRLEAEANGGRTDYANTIYLATVSKGKVTEIKPVANIEENAVLRAVFGGRAMEGTIGVRTRQGDYSFTAALPVRIEFAGSPERGQLTGRISNATSAVRSAKGSCFAPLNRTRANPLVGKFTAKIGIQRVPSMHGAFDDELILIWATDESNMGDAYYPSVATLLGGDRLGPTWETSLHGVPSLGPPVNLRLVTGGGRTC